MQCVFCNDVKRSGDVVFEDETCWVVLHDDWSVRGHAMIVAKRHAENVSDLYEDEWTHLTLVWQRAERVLLDLTKSDRAIAMKLGIATPHLHIHIYPVSAGATRAQVFEAIDAKRRVEREEGFVEAVRKALGGTAG